MRDRLTLGGLAVICALWFYSHQTHLRLLAQREQHAHDLQTLQGLVRDTQEHADLIVRMRCNASHIVNGHVMLRRARARARGARRARAVPPRD